MQGVFTAGDGDLSIVYQSGAHVWGAWNVNYSEGIEPEDFEADRALGYVGDTGDAGDELAARMWIRSDVSIDQDSSTSTLPTVFRDAAERMTGDVVVERTVSGLGLGGLVPYVDFHHSDEMGTVIGSKVVPLPVNNIEFSTDVEGGTDYVVSVGKGLLGNREERDLRNAQLEAQIFQEIAERKREQARIAEQQERDRKVAEDAKKAAADADRAADAADRAAAAAKTRADSAYSTAGTANNRAGTLEINETNIFTWANSATSRMTIFDNAEFVANYTARTFRHVFDAVEHLYDAIQSAQRGNSVTSDINNAKSDITSAESDTSIIETQYGHMARTNFTLYNPIRSGR